MINFITFGSNASLVPLAFIAGLLYAAVLYYRNRVEDISTRMHVALFVLRFFAASAIVLMLFNPLMRRKETSIEKPVVVLAHDNSLSPAATADSLYYKAQWTEQWQLFAGNLSAEYTVRSLLFGDQVSEGLVPSFDEYYTDMSLLGDELSRRFGGRNVAAVVVAGDGIINRGPDPAWSYHLDAPLYTIALGDTTPATDRYIHNIRTNEVTYLGNRFPLEVELGATLNDGEPLSVTVTKNGKRITSTSLVASGEKYFNTLDFFLDADEPGLQRYTVAVSQGQDEINIRNNRHDFYIRVLDGRKKVALISGSLSPDLSALRQAIAGLNTYETDYVDFRKSENFQPADYDIVILYGLSGESTLREQITAAGIPVFLISTHNDDYNGFNAWNAGININLQGASYNLATAVVNPDFSAFKVPSVLSDIALSFAPLNVPFADFDMAGGVSTLLYQKIGSVETDMPLLSVSKSLDTRYVMLLGDGFWKWRIRNNDNKAAFDQLVAGALQYLSIRDEKQFLYVNTREQYYENETVSFEAQVYDDNYQLTTDRDVSLVLTNDNGDTFPFGMVAQGNSYVLDAGRLIPGRYSWRATVMHDGQLLAQAGAFVVSEVVAELNNLVADHTLLRNFALRNDGSLVYPSSLERLQNELLEDNNAKPVVTTREIFMELINDYRLLALILLLLSAEWFLRRYLGSY